LSRKRGTRQAETPKYGLKCVGERLIQESGKGKGRGFAFDKKGTKKGEGKGVERKGRRRTKPAARVTSTRLQGNEGKKEEEN